MEPVEPRMVLALGRCPEPAGGQQEHTQQTADGTLPALARADGGRQLAPAESLAAEVGRDIGHPHQQQHRQQKAQAHQACVHHRKPGAGDEHQADRQAQARGPGTPTFDAATERHHRKQHPDRTHGEPQQAQ